MRLENWPDRMFEVIARHAAIPFAWGVSDCMQLVMDSNEAITGAHPYPKAKAYRSQRGAAACLRRHGFETIVEALAAKYDLVPVAMAQRGDNGVVQVAGVLSSVLCEGASWVGKTEGGIIRLSRAHVVQAFRVT